MLCNQCCNDINFVFEFYKKCLAGMDTIAEYESRLHSGNTKADELSVQLIDDTKQTVKCEPPDTSNDCASNDLADGNTSPELTDLLSDNVRIKYENNVLEEQKMAVSAERSEKVSEDPCESQFQDIKVEIEDEDVQGERYGTDFYESYCWEDDVKVENTGDIDEDDIQKGTSSVILYLCLFFQIYLVFHFLFLYFIWLY